MIAKNTLVIGASDNPSRYSYRAIQMLLENGIKVYPMGVKKTDVLGLTILKPCTSIPDEVHTVSLYVNPDLQKDYYSFVESLKPKRVIFNPGTENPQWAKELEKSGIEPVFACNLVMLTVGNF